MDLERMQALLTALQEARFAGLRSVSYDGKTVTYGSDAELAAAEARVAELGETARRIDAQFSQANEALASAREARAGAVARAENEEARRAEIGEGLPRKWSREHARHIDHADTV